MRNKEVVLYSFYKNWAYVLVYVYLQFVAGECAAARQHDLRPHVKSLDCPPQQLHPKTRSVIAVMS